MSILSFNNLSQSFGDFDLFQNISGTLAHGDKVGLVGPNGVGKTTLVHALVGETRPTTGAVHLAKQTRVGYLHQEALHAFQANAAAHVYDEMLGVFADLREQAAELEVMTAKMADGTADDSLFEAYSQAQESFERAGGYAYEQRIKQVLNGLGFTADNWHTPITHLSGGQKTRALLARLLLERPELLVLDEPTNHLDINAVEWLEGMLNIWEGTILIVSHDRYFLDRVVKTVWEMSATVLEVYRGNYTAYTQQREERWERKRKELEADQARLAKEMDYIRRNLAGQRTSQAKGKLKRLNSELGVDGKALKLWRTEDKLKEYQSQRVQSEAKTFNLQLKSDMRSGKLVLRTYDLAVGYNNEPLFTAENLELTRLECAALIGPNGSGKTTFLKTVLENHPAVAGEAKLGASLKVGYFSQAHESLNLNNSVLDELLHHKHMLISEARSYLGQYMFSGVDVEKKVSTLSGGERGRLALAILALQQANFLLLDEPTNHLDIPAQELLQSVLESFDGTILMVSHDRYLIDQLATQIWVVDPPTGRMRVYAGTYQDYLTRRDQERAALHAEIQAKKSKKAALQSAPAEKPTRSKNEQRRLEQALAEVESKIEETESAKETASDDLQAASEAQDFDKIQRKSIEYNQLEAKLEELMDEWAVLAEKLSE